MDFEALAFFAALFVTLTSLAILIVTDWRISIGLLAAQYIGVFLLVALEWPLAMAVVKLVAGWMASAVLGMAMVSLPQLNGKINPSRSISTQPGRPDTTTPSSRLFYLLAAFLVGLVVVSQTPRVTNQLPDIGFEQVWGGLILIGLGLLRLGFTAQPLPTTLGLLTLFSGFETLYARLEAAPLTAGLLAGINLGLALAGAYLLLASHMEEAE